MFNTQRGRIMPSLLAAFFLLVGLATTTSEVLTRTIIVRGTVTAQLTKAPVVGANVYVLTAASAQTDSTGAYVLRVSVPDTARSLMVRVRALGFSPAALPVKITGDTMTVAFAMRQDTHHLDEVVVTAGGLPADLQAKVGLSILRQQMSATGATVDRFNTEEYARIEDNRFLSVASAPLSTFSADVDRASYSNVRRFVNEGTLPPKDAVRIEEMINYFSYAYAEPTGAEPVSITTEIAIAPWNTTHRVVRIGLQSKRIKTEHLPPNNLVFLLDVSGSMMPANKLPLVKQAFRLLVNELREQDRVAIVVYAGNAGLVLPSTSGADKEAILGAIERLEAGGSTAGGAGIKLAYDIAKQNFLPNGNNRVVLATDGDFNVGVSSTAELTRMVEERRAEGTYLTVLGFGMGNIKDNRLEQLADKGNGNYAYVDDLMEARKVLVTELGATLFTVAKDVKLQVEFNPSAVQAYRLIGYENRLLKNEDFVDDKKDAGEMGAGHSVTALYEVVPAGAKLDVALGTTPPLRYQQVADARRPTATSREVLFVNVRYKLPKDSTSRLMQHAVVAPRAEASSDLRFAMAVAGYGMLLRDSEFKGTLTWDDVIALATKSADDSKIRHDFVSLVTATQRLAPRIAKVER
jgi:Ca-activated chloride channel family protein